MLVAMIAAKGGVIGVLILTAQAVADPAVTVDGYVEAFYQYNFNRPSNLITAYRGFDDRASSFTIQNAVLDVTGTTGAVSTRIALQVGHAPASYYGAEPRYQGQAGTGASDPELWRLIQQAYVGYTAGKLRTEGGIFLSPIGLEGIAVKDQWNWSRSNLFYALPYYHAGVRATYPLSSEVSATAYVTNGWNDVVNRNPYPCVAAILAWTPSPALSGTVLYFGGVEPQTGAPEGQPWRHLFDANATWSVTTDITLGAQLDTGFERNNFGTSSWFAAAAGLRAHPLPRLYAAARADYFHEGVAPGASRLFFPADDVGSGTLTLDYRPTADNLSVRLEFRDDTASSAMYFRRRVATDVMTGLDVPTATSQQTLTLGAVGWF
jgi:hypothetical protein